MRSDNSSSIAAAHSPGPVSTIITAWLLAGTIDITAASVYFPLVGKFKLIMLYQGIASGVLGARAFTGGFGTAVLGLALHYLIALIWTTFFFLLFPRVGFLSKNRIVTAAAYGIFVSCVMTFVVLPLSNVHHFPIIAVHFLISTVILMFTIGLPITTIVGRYHSSGRVKKALTVNR